MSGARHTHHHVVWWRRCCTRDPRRLKRSFIAALKAASRGATTAASLWLVDQESGDCLAHAAPLLCVQRSWLALCRT